MLSPEKGPLATRSLKSQGALTCSWKVTVPETSPVNCVTLGQPQKWHRFEVWKNVAGAPGTELVIAPLITVLLATTVREREVGAAICDDGTPGSSGALTLSIVSVPQPTRLTANRVAKALRRAE